MSVSTKAVRPCTLSSAATPTTTTTTKPTAHIAFRKSIENQTMNNLERLLDPIDYNSLNTCRFSPRPVRLGKRWKEYQGIQNWEGLLDPLDDNLRDEILRYGEFVEAAYKSFDFDPSSPTYASCRFPKNTLLDRSGLPQTGYRPTKHLRATSGINLPRWMDKAPTWLSTQSSWIGYVAVCQDKEEIARLGRRDVVMAFRGTATCLEWLENLRARLTHLPGNNVSGAMVESGFLSLYTSGNAISPSLQDMVREEINRLLQIYGEEPLSLTITGHSLGAALATLAAYDIKANFNHAPMVTVISFGGPRVGNRSFRQHLEKQGTKVLRIVNSDDLITKIPGFVIDGDDHVSNVKMAGLPSWIQKQVEDTQWTYAEIGRELRLSSRDSPYVNSINFATCHELKTYLHLVNGFVSSTCPFRATARNVLNNHARSKVEI
ncbi:phospholipase A(1) DAD1, chloroplastic-like [Mangifera indica]|uniref:phospholipase A(1) DAD1, chloroplastic-like n=1 Tax=Mangifera indica TaxID=29780 RepID=UPI001CFC1372|nr:phospholipase A(1) DAD1, chloroplastic-like [Mangifera indica]